MPEISNQATTVNISGPGDIVTKRAVSLEDPATTGTTGLAQSIEDFLEKPLFINTVTFATSNLVNDVLWTGNLYQLITTTSIWKNKMSGFGNLSATVRVTLQVNCSPFNCGGLLLHFLPNYYANPQSHTGRSSLISKSQQPSIKFDVNTNAEIAMDIPYIGTTKTMSLAEQSSDWGQVLISVWSPFRGGSASPTSCSIAIWFSLHDVKLTKPVLAQSNIKKGQRGAIRPGRPKPQPSEQEHGPISKTLSAVSVLAATLSTIPVLTPIAGPVAWFSNIAAGVATAFGWSKPLNDNNGTRIVNGLHFGAPNSNGMDNSQALSLLADNKIRVLSDLGGTHEDEMSINYLKTVPCYVGTFQMNATDTQGLLKTISLNPGSFFSQRVVGPTTISSMAPLCFLANAFSVYRGGINVRFHIFKTGLHAGRLVFAFVPGVGYAPTSITDTTSLHRVIVDVAETQEFCLTFPYTLKTDYIPTGQSLGDVYIYTLNPLQAPAAASSVVDITYEVFGADDMEFQIPQNKGMQPILAQAGGDPGIEICEEMGASGITSSVSGASEYCIGEYVGSLLQLLKRYTYFKMPINGNGVITRVNPFIKDAYLYSSSATIPPNAGCDYFTLFSSFYAYSRGGVRVRVVSGDSTNYWSAWIQSPPSTTTVASTPVSTTDLPTTNTQSFVSPMTQAGRECGISVQVPYYCMTYATLNNLRQGTSQQPDLPLVNACFENVGVAANNPARTTFYRAAADDFQLSYFIGIPEIVFT